MWKSARTEDVGRYLLIWGLMWCPALAAEDPIPANESSVSSSHPAKKWVGSVDMNGWSIQRGERAAEIVDLAGHQETGCAHRKALRDGHHRGVGPMRGSECVVDVVVGEAGELGGEFRLLLRLLLSWVKAQVLE